jgi:hypothetical protein
MMPKNISEEPIFLFASGHRTGSTLLQRLLNSCPDCLIWGEHNGYLNGFKGEYEKILEWEKLHSGIRKTFLLQGYGEFIANMTPEVYELKNATHLHITALFGLPAAKVGRSTWGFKEVRYGAEIVLFLQDFYPKARFIHLTRNVIDCFISMKRWENSSDPWNREWTKVSLANWARINESFYQKGDQISNLLQIKYEEMISNPGKTIKTLAKYLKISQEDFDREVFEIRVNGTVDTDHAEHNLSKTQPELTIDEKELLTQNDIVRAARLYNYEIGF